MTNLQTHSSGFPLYPPRASGLKGRRKSLTFLGIFAFLAFMPWLPIFGWFTIFDTSTNYGLGNIAYVFAYAAAGVGFNLLIGYSGTLGLAHAGIFALGAYGTTILSGPKECIDYDTCETIIRPAASGYAFPFLLSLPVVCIVAALIGVAVGFPAARLKGFYLAIATLALGELIIKLISLDAKIWSGLKTNAGTGKQVPIFEFFGSGQLKSAYFLSLAALFITMLAYIIYTENRLGRTLKAVRDIEIATGPLGISSTYYKLLAFGLSSFAAAFAGAAWAQNSAFVNPSSFRTRLLVFLLVVVILGGLGKLWGPLVGAFIFVYLRQEFQDQQKLLFFLIGVALMLAILLLPEGFASLPDRMRDSRWLKDIRRRFKPLKVSR
jgi:branched-chain amino acid transport system permease protein